MINAIYVQSSREMKKVISLYPFHWNKSIIACSLEVAPASSGETFEWIPCSDKQNCY